MDLIIRKELIKIFSQGESLDQLCRLQPLELFLLQAQKTIGYEFKKPALLVQALLHPSFINEIQGSCYQSNQRLEFLGDSVLDLIVSEKLFEKFKEYDEGTLSKMKAACVNEVSLFQVAETIALYSYILTGKGEQESLKQSLGILSDALEAILGAIFLDSSVEQAKKIFQRWVDQYEKGNQESFYDLKRLNFFDPKSSLQEKTLRDYSSLPEYQADDLEGGNYKVKLVIDKKIMGEVTMNSKRQAEKFLASEYLKKYYKEL